MYSLGKWRLLGLCARRAAAPNLGGARLRNFLILLLGRPVFPIHTLPNAEWPPSRAQGFAITSSFGTATSRWELRACADAR